MQQSRWQLQSATSKHRASDSICSYQILSIHQWLLILSSRPTSIVLLTAFSKFSIASSLLRHNRKTEGTVDSPLFRAPVQVSLAPSSNQPHLPHYGLRGISLSIILSIMQTLSKYFVPSSIVFKKHSPALSTDSAILLRLGTPHLRPKHVEEKCRNWFTIVKGATLDQEHADVLYILDSCHSAAALTRLLYMPTEVWRICFKQELQRSSQLRSPILASLPTTTID